MSQWTTFLQQQGAEIRDGCAVSFGETPTDYPTLAEEPRLFALDDRGLLRLSGPDTEKLLQGQITCDVEQLKPGTPQPGALCTPKGRMISNFILVKREADDFLLVLHRGLADATRETLQKYAVFYKTEIEDVTESHRVLGLSGAETAPAVAAAGEGEGTLFVPTGERRFIGLVTTGKAEAVWQQMAANAAPAGLPFWHLLAIREGRGETRPETREEFIPQMLNLQCLGAINFRKGCYTGQEIVARMHYLGKLKRRMYRLAVAGETPPIPGTSCQLPGKSANAGHVVMGERADGRILEILAVLTSEAAASPELVLGDRTLAVEFLPLPYDDQLQQTS